MLNKILIRWFWVDVTTKAWIEYIAVPPLYKNLDGALNFFDSVNFDAFHYNIILRSAIDGTFLGSIKACSTSSKLMFLAIQKIKNVGYNCVKTT